MALSGIATTFGKDKDEMTLEPASKSMEFPPRRCMTMRRKTDG